MHLTRSQLSDKLCHLFGIIFLTAALEIYSKLPLHFHNLDSPEECTSLHRVVASNSPVVQQRLRRGVTVNESRSKSHSVSHKPAAERTKSLASRRRSRAQGSVSSKRPCKLAHYNSAWCNSAEYPIMPHSGISKRTQSMIVFKSLTKGILLTYPIALL